LLTGLGIVAYVRGDSEERIERNAMPASLRQHMNELASAFASNVLHAIRTASLQELLAESTGGRHRAAPVAPATAAPRATGRRSRRLKRRSAGQIGNMIESIVALLAKHAAGLRAEQIRDALHLQSKELPRPLKEALDSGRIVKSGQKRATTYRARGAGGPSAASHRKAGRRAATKRGRPAAGKARKGAKARRATKARKRVARKGKKK
jgi:hypothetical protein